MRSMRGRNGRNFPFGNPSLAFSPSPMETEASHMSIGPTNSASYGSSSMRPAMESILRGEM